LTFPGKKKFYECKNGDYKLAKRTRMSHKINGNDMCKMLGSFLKDCSCPHPSKHLTKNGIKTPIRYYPCKTGNELHKKFHDHLKSESLMEALRKDTSISKETVKRLEIYQKVQKKESLDQIEEKHINKFGKEIISHSGLWFLMRHYFPEYKNANHNTCVCKMCALSKQLLESIKKLLEKIEQKQNEGKDVVEEEEELKLLEIEFEIGKKHWKQAQKSNEFVKQMKKDPPPGTVVIITHWAAKLPFYALQHQQIDEYFNCPVLSLNVLCMFKKNDKGEIEKKVFGIFPERPTQDAIASIVSVTVMLKSQEGKAFIGNNKNLLFISDGGSHFQNSFVKGFEMDVVNKKRETHPHQFSKGFNEIPYFETVTHFFTIEGHGKGDCDWNGNIIKGLFQFKYNQEQFNYRKEKKNLFQKQIYLIFIKKFFNARCCQIDKMKRRKSKNYSTSPRAYQKNFH